MTDEDIIQAVLEGDTRMYKNIVEKYQQGIFRVGMGLVHNKEDAEEITQDCFVKAYQHLKDFKHEALFSTWLYRIAVNTALHFLKKQKRRALLNFFSEEMVIADKSANAEEVLEGYESFDKIKRAIEALPFKQATAFTLSKYENLPQRQIAAIMNISEGAMEQLLIRAKNNLQKKLNKP